MRSKFTQGLALLFVLILFSAILPRVQAAEWTDFVPKSTTHKYGPIPNVFNSRLLPPYSDDYEISIVYDREPKAGEKFLISVFVREKPMKFSSSQTAKGTTYYPYGNEDYFAKNRLPAIDGPSWLWESIQNWWLRVQVKIDCLSLEGSKRKNLTLDKFFIFSPFTSTDFPTVVRSQPFNNSSEIYVDARSKLFMHSDEAVTEFDIPNWCRHLAIRGDFSESLKGTYRTPNGEYSAIAKYRQQPIAFVRSGGAIPRYLSFYDSNSNSVANEIDLISIYENLECSKNEYKKTIKALTSLSFTCKKVGNRFLWTLAPIKVPTPTPTQGESNVCSKLVGRDVTSAILSREILNVQGLNYVVIKLRNVDYLCNFNLEVYTTFAGCNVSGRITLRPNETIKIIGRPNVYDTLWTRSFFPGLSTCTDRMGISESQTFKVVVATASRV